MPTYLSSFFSSPAPSLYQSQEEESEEHEESEDMEDSSEPRKSEESTPSMNKRELFEAMDDSKMKKRKVFADLVDLCEHFSFKNIYMGFLDRIFPCLLTEDGAFIPYVPIIMPDSTTTYHFMVLTEDAPRSTVQVSMKPEHLPIMLAPLLKSAKPSEKHVPQLLLNTIAEHCSDFITEEQCAQHRQLFLDAPYFYDEERDGVRKSLNEWQSTEQGVKIMMLINTRIIPDVSERPVAGEEATALPHIEYSSVCTRCASLGLDECKHRQGILPPKAEEATPSPEPKEEKPVEEPFMCLVCYDNPPTTCVHPCGCVVVCSLCSPRLQATADHQTCLKCRRPIDSIEDLKSGLVDLL